MILTTIKTVNGLRSSCGRLYEPLANQVLLFACQVGCISL